MKIVQIGSYPLDASCIKGGIEVSVYGLAIEQAKNHQLIVLDIPRPCIKNDYSEEIDGLTVFRFSTGSGNNYSSLFRLKTVFAVVRAQHPDICHIHTTSLFSFIIYLLLRFFRIPSIVTVHGLAHIEKKNAWLKERGIRNYLKYITQSLTEFLFLSICPLLIVDTQYVAEAIGLYKKQWKIVRMPICKIIPQGINADFFQLENAMKKNHLLAIGAISKRKGHLFLIEAMQKVKAQFPDFSLAIVGALSDNQYYQLMQSSIKEKRFENNIRIYPNASFAEILKFYKSAEIFVLHSEEESQGIVFCEAMAAGKPIVATNVGGVSWVVENNVNGLLSAFEDINSFATNILKLLENNTLLKNMGEINKIKSRKYDWKCIVAEIMDLYKSLLPG